MTDLFPGDPRSNLERMRAGDPYVADDPAMAEANRRAIRLARAYDLAYTEDPEAAEALLRDLLGTVGEGVVVRPPLTVDYGSEIQLGAGTFVNSNLTALDVAPITIGDRCLLGPNVQLLTPTHPVDPGPRALGIEGAAPITLGTNVWLGGGATVLAGVTIGDNTVVGAGAVVTRDLPADVVAVGNPARVLRSVHER